VLTALAAVITAATGLVVALRPSDAPRRATEPPAVTATNSPAEAVAPPSTTPTPVPAAASGDIPLPSGRDVRLARGDVAIRMLSARLEPFSPEKRALVLSLRHTNNSRYPQNFWTASYRLVVDGVPRAPTNSLNQVVEGESAQEGEVIFEVPVQAKQVVLRISAGDDRTEIPLDLPAAKP
jgi:hypothetical protein